MKILEKTYPEKLFSKSRKHTSKFWGNLIIGKYPQVLVNIPKIVNFGNL